MRSLALCLLFFLPLTAEAQVTNSFPNFTDILLVDKEDEAPIYIEGQPRDSIHAMQDTLDALPQMKKREGVMLRFNPRSIELDTVINTAENIYRCGIPVIFLFDITIQHIRSEIVADPYLFALNRMPRHDKFLRMLDINEFLFLPTVRQTHVKTPLPSIAGPIAGSVGIILLAIASYVAGLFISRTKSRWWVLGYAIPILPTALIAIARWYPTLEMRMPFRILMYDRREYIVMAMATSLLLAVPVARLNRKLTAVLTSLFAVLFVIHFSLLPFLLPAFNRQDLIAMHTTFDRYGVCMQNTGYTCGPAAAVTALREFDISAEEGELAVFAHSTSSAGTPPELLCGAIEKLYRHKDIRCQFRSFSAAKDLKGNLPAIAIVKFGFLVDHFVTVLRVTDTYITVADPATGLRIMDVDDFEAEWRKSAIIVSHRDES